MRRTLFKFPGHVCVTGGTEIFVVIFDQAAIVIVVNGMTIKATETGAEMRVGGGHSGLVNGSVTAAAQFRLLVGSQAADIGDGFGGWIIQMFFPSVMTSDTSDSNG